MALTGEQIRWILIASVFGVALLACLFFVWKGKKKDGALVMLCGSLLVAFFALSDFASVAEYGSGSLAPVGEGEIAVTLEIDASLAGEGYLLAPREVALAPGESVLDLLLRVTEAEGIRVEYTGGYVEGIGDLYELDRGDQSGWMYAVNGDAGSVSSAEYLPKSGDVIRWYYVTSYEEGGVP